ncbi:MAG: hypothetical protein MI919_42170, partial [Holophagales bacterium]|nr:hypothetical protein [Holophagales bacterium]
RNALLTGNPFYPWFWSIFGGPDWSTELADQLARWQAGIGMGREPLDYLLLPLRVVVAGGRGYDRFDGSIGVFWLLAGPLALWGAWAAGGSRGRALRICLAGAAVSFAFWALTAQQMRFLIPALAPLALAAALSARELGDRLGSRLARQGKGRAEGVARGAGAARGSLRRLAPLAGGASVALLLGLELAAEHGRFLAAGASHLRLYATPAFHLDPLAPRPEVFGSVDRLEPEAKLLMLHTNQGFYANREYLADSFFEASQIAQWLDAPSTAEVRRRLELRGVTHLLIDRRPRGARYPEALLQLLREPGHLKLVHQDATHVLLELLPPAPEEGEG